MRNELMPCPHCGRAPATNTELDVGLQDSAQVAALAASQVHPDSALPSRPTKKQGAPVSAPVPVAGVQETAWLAFCDQYDGSRLTGDMREALEFGLDWPRVAAAVAEVLEPVEGDLLPPLGSKVLIHLARQDAWVEHAVTGYYVWGALSHQVREGEKNAHRVFVRVKDAQGYDNARLLSEVRAAARGAAGQEGGAA